MKKKKKKRKERIIRYRGVPLKGTSFIPLVRRNFRGTTVKYFKLMTTFKGTFVCLDLATLYSEQAEKLLLGQKEFPRK